jgi:hypothetical protein
MVVVLNQLAGLGWAAGLRWAGSTILAGQQGHVAHQAQVAWGNGHNLEGVMDRPAKEPSHNNLPRKSDPDPAYKT